MLQRQKESVITSLCAALRHIDQPKDPRLFAHIRLLTCHTQYHAIIVMRKHTYLQCGWLSFALVDQDEREGWPLLHGLICDKRHASRPVACP